MRRLYAITGLELRGLASTAVNGGGFLFCAGMVVGFLAGGGHNNHAPSFWGLLAGASLLIGMAGLMIRDWRDILKLMYRECAAADKTKVIE